MANTLLKLLVGVAISLAVLWLALIVALLVARPKGDTLKELLRILPDTLRLIRRLAGDRGLPRPVRARLWLLMVYLAMPIDVIPDFIPILGHVDDAILTALVLRSVVKSAGLEVLTRQWPGTEEGLAALVRLAGLKRQAQ